MEWIVIIIWLSIINGALGGQYVLNWMANQPKYTGNMPIDISPGVMTWWREISKLSWAVVATATLQKSTVSQIRSPTAENTATG